MRFARFETVFCRRIADGAMVRIRHEDFDDELFEQVEESEESEESASISDFEDEIENAKKKRLLEIASLVGIEVSKSSSAERVRDLLYAELDAS